MKNTFKKLSLFILFSFVFSCLAGCSKTESNSTANPPVNNNVLVANNNAADSNPVSNTSKSEYPEVPAGIRQANIEALDSGNFTLEDKKGKVVLVNLWGIWCGPCKAEMPHLVELQEKYKEQGFEIIGLNVGDEDGNKESAENMKSFAEKMKLNYQLGWADDEVYNDLLKLSKFGGVPQSFLIDREGHLYGVFLGGGQNTVNKMKDSVERIMAAN